MFSCLSPERRVRPDYPLRAIRAMADLALRRLSRRFAAMYAVTGRLSIPPEKLLRAQVLQMRYSVRRERLLMEEICASSTAIKRRRKLRAQSCELADGGVNVQQTDGIVPIVRIVFIIGIFGSLLNSECP
jgi:hypothetical protein